MAKKSRKVPRPHQRSTPKQPAPEAVKGLSRTVVRWIVIVVLGSFLLSFGASQLMLVTGVTHPEGLVVEATVVECSSVVTCQVEFFADNEVRRSEFHPGTSAPGVGSKMQVIYNRQRPDVVLSTKPPSPAVGIVVSVLGMGVMAYGLVRLFRHWRAERHPGKSSSAAHKKSSRSRRRR